MIMTVSKAKEIINKVPDGALIVLDVLDLNTLTHYEHKRITIPDGERLVCSAKNIDYEDNDFFGRMSLEREVDRVHNLLFPQIYK